MAGGKFAAKIEALRRQLIEMERQVTPADIAADPVVGPTFEELHTALEELHISEEELTRRNEELIQAQKSLLKAQSSIEDERKRYRDLFEFAPDGYLITDSNGLIWQANRAAGFMLRVRSDLLEGRPLVSFITPDSEEAFHTYLQRMTNLTPVQEFELRLKGRADAPTIVSVRLAAERDREGQPMSLRWMLRDVTEQKRNTERLRMLNVELESRVAERTAELANASKAKDQFLAVLSHELRTPLTPVLTAAMALDQEAHEPDEVHRLADTIRRNVELEARLIEDLLDLTRVAQGKMTFQHEPVNLHDAIGRTIETCRSDMRGKHHHMNLELNARRHVVSADWARIQQVLWNLLKNAVKFTPEGGTIVVRTADADDDRVRIEVSDTGIGMEENVARRAFDAFTQGGEAITKQYGGMGLGLAISKTIVDAHGGTLTASSNGPGKGSTFAIELPGATEPQPAPPADDGGARQAPPKSLRILLVEDHADTARLMARLLRRLGHTVHVVDTVAAGIDVSEREEIDLVLSDLGLPDGTGIDLMRRLRERKPVNAIALSGYGMAEDVRKSLAAGFRKHLTKPVSFSHLQAAIESVMS
jgi:PAS domain S-box-containing protein